MKTYDLIFDQKIQETIKMGIKILQEFPQSKTSLMRSLTHLPNAIKRRNYWKKKDVIVPPLLIVSTTEKCNLHCIGCYAQTNCRDTGNEMTRPQIDELLAQAVEAGCSMILLAGGEPLLCETWLEAVASRSELLGLVFTNGTLLNEERADWFSANRNMIPLFSVEGDAQKTDERRGEGVALCIENAMQELSKRAIPFGLSITTGEHNIQEVTSRSFLEPFIKSGCRLTIFTEYVPVDENNKMFALTEASKLALQNFCHTVSKEENLILIPFPGDEAVFDGCLAAGRGFAHISSAGELEPCPFAAYSDRNVLNTSLIDALSSPLFQKIRSESKLLHEGAGGCALRNMNYHLEI